MTTPIQNSKWTVGIRAKIERGEWVEKAPGVFGCPEEPKKQNMYTVSKTPNLSEFLPSQAVPKHIKEKYKRFGIKYTPQPKAQKTGHAPAAPVKELKPMKPVDLVERGTQLWSQFENMAGSGDAEYTTRFADSMTRLHGKYEKIQKERRHIMVTNKKPPKVK
jgi:hypothetical protein